MTSEMSQPIVAWTIGGSDSCAGAGIQADLKAMQSLDVHCCSVITVVTAQNTKRVVRIEEMDASLVKDQLHALWEDAPPVAIKLGMLHSKKLIETVSDFLAGKKSSFFLLCDPVMVATSKDVLLQPDAIESLRMKILSIVDLVTPNLLEARALAS